MEISPAPGSDPLPRTPPALVVTGMHRSGTSLTAAILASAGVDMGDHLLGADAANPRGHFEDVDLLLFHQRVLAANGMSADGFVAAGEPEVPALLLAEAHDIVAARRAKGRLWGWKEPRTVLFLDFWEQLLPEARFVFVFRRPWEVIDSLFRRGNAEFLAEPRLALAVWRHSNETILRFTRRAAGRCLVVDAAQVVDDQAGFAAAVRTRLDLPVGFPSPQCDPALFHSEHASWRPWIVRQLDPRAWELYLELRSLAGSSSPLPPLAGEAGGTETALEAALAEWSRAGRAEGRLAAAGRSATT
jgi:O-antigen biosynthesis protein